MRYEQREFASRQLSHQDCLTGASGCLSFAQRRIEANATDLPKIAAHKTFYVFGDTFLCTEPEACDLSLSQSLGANLMPPIAAVRSSY